MADTNKAKETASNIAQDSSEIFDTYKKGVLKVTEEVSKFQPQYVQMISNLQQEYMQMIKQFVDNFSQHKEIGQVATYHLLAQHFQLIHMHHTQNNLEDNLTKSLHRH